MSTAMSHIQKLTMTGRSEEEEGTIPCDYQIETNPVSWKDENFQESYSLVSELAR